MKQRMINTERIEGRLYQHNLAIKTVQNQASANFGKEFISGEIEIAVDEEGLNVIPVHFTYVVESNTNGNPNVTYSNLRKIIESNKSWITVGKDEAMVLRIDTALALNDFYTQDDKLVSTKRNEGGFVTIINANSLSKEEERSTFTMDMVITSVARVEADEEKGTEEHALVKGAVFNFRNDLLPVDFKVTTQEGMNYFEDLGATQATPVFTKLWGRINCNSIVREIREETAFGEASVRTTRTKNRDWCITGSATLPYEFGDESTITLDELKQKTQDRELVLADIKKRSDEYKAQKAQPTQTQVKPAATTVTPTPQVTTGTFNF